MGDARSAIHLRPSAELAQRVLLPGDPHRALTIAQAQLERPLMFNHRRGLWGYSGKASDGDLLTIQSTGMGGPSAAIVVEELIDLGARTFVRVGTCGALVPELSLGDVLAASTVLAEDGTSTALGAEGRVEPSPEITAGLIAAGARPATVVSTDLFYDDRRGAARRWVDNGAQAVEMEAAAVLTVAERRGARAGCVLAVTDLLAAGDSDRGAGRDRIEEPDLEAAELRLGEVACRALHALHNAGAAGASV